MFIRGAAPIWTGEVEPSSHRFRDLTWLMVVAVFVIIHDGAQASLLPDSQSSLVRTGSLLSSLV